MTNKAHMLMQEWDKCLRDLASFGIDGSMQGISRSFSGNFPARSCIILIH